MDQSIGTCFKDATAIFQRFWMVNQYYSFKADIGHCFYSSLLHYKMSFRIATGNKQTSASIQDKQIDERREDLTCKVGHLQQALSLADKALHCYLTHQSGNDVRLEEAGVGQKLQHPMQGNIALLSDWIHDELGSVTQAQ